MKFLRFIFLAFVLFCIAYAVKGQSYSSKTWTGTWPDPVPNYDGWTFTYNMTWSLSHTVGSTKYYKLTGSATRSKPGETSAGVPIVINYREPGFSAQYQVNQATDVPAFHEVYPIMVLPLTQLSVGSWVSINTGGEAPPPPAEKRVRIAGTNSSERPLFIVLRSGASEIIGNVNAAAGAAYDQTFTVTDAQEAAGLHIDTYSQDAFTDGVWIQQDVFDIETATKIGTAEAAAVSLPPGGIPDAPHSAYADRGPSGSAPTAESSTGSTWTADNATSTTVDENRLDKATYREGVDKLERAINGKAGDVPMAPTTPGTPAFTAPANANRLTSKLPTAPTVAAPTAPVTAITFNFKIPFLQPIPVTIDFDQPGFSGPISIFRGIMLGVVGLIYLVLSIRTVRGAFAGK